MPAIVVLICMLLLPLAEIAAFVVVGRQLGVLATLALVVLAAAIGVLVLRREGSRIAALLREDGAAGRGSPRPPGDAAMTLAAGLLLITPGFVTDAIGLALLVPAVRKAALSFLASRATVVAMRWGVLRRGHGATDGPRRGDVIDLDASEYADSDQRGRR